MTKAKNYTHCRRLCWLIFWTRKENILENDTEKEFENFDNGKCRFYSMFASFIPQYEEQISGFIRVRFI